MIEAIQQEKEIDKVMLKQGVRGELFQQLFSLIGNGIFLSSMCRKMFLSLSPIRNHHQGVLAEISPVPYQDLTEVLMASKRRDGYIFVLILTG